MSQVEISWSGGEEPETFQELVDAAIVDAELTGQTVLVVGCPGKSSSDDNRGAAYARDLDIYAGETLMDLDSRLDVLNSRESRAGIRVAICVSHPDVVIAGLIRHELEHARQFDHLAPPSGRGLNLHCRAVEVFHDVPRLPGSARLYGAVPMEQDANAAAALFVRSFFGSECIDEVTETHPDESKFLSRPAARPELSTIEDRMKRFIRNDGPDLARRVLDTGQIDT